MKVLILNTIFFLLLSCVSKKDKEVNISKKLSNDYNRKDLIAKKDSLIDNNEFIFKSKFHEANFNLLYKKFMADDLSHREELSLFRNMKISLSFSSNYLSIFLPKERQKLIKQKDKERYVLFLCLVSKASQFKNYYDLNICKEIIYEDLDSNYKGLFSHNELVSLIEKDSKYIIKSEDSLRYEYSQILLGN